MTNYKIYELYNYTVTYNVQADNEEAAIDKVLDDPIEYRDFELDDGQDHNLVYRIIEKEVDND